MTQQFVPPQNNANVQREYARYMARQVAQEAARARAQVAQRRLGLVDEKDKEEAMRQAHMRVAQIADANWDYLSEHMGGWMSQSGRERLARYEALDDAHMIFADTMPFPVEVAHISHKGEITYTTEYLAGTPGPWLMRLMQVNTSKALPLLRDYAELTQRYREEALI